MYLQITTRCNMKCAHCCMSATSRGQDMSPEVFYAACKIAEDYGSHITIGGGEPTMHPLFDQFFGKALMVSHMTEGGLCVITNGTDTNRALALLHMAKAEVISAELSDDEWHDSWKVDERVRAYARKNNLIRSVKRISAQGRGKRIAGAEKTCACETAIVIPNGDVWACLCKTHKLGNVLDHAFDPGEFGMADECWESEYHPRHDKQEIA